MTHPQYRIYFLVPHPVQNFKVVQNGDDYVSLSWELPKVTNGPILGYTIEYRQVSSCAGTKCFEKKNKEVDIINTSITKGLKVAVGVLFGIKKKHLFY